MRRSKEPHDTFEELEVIGQGLVGWAQAHLVLLAIIGAGILVVAAVVGGAQSWRRAQSDEASAAVADLRREFVVAMGGAPNDAEVPEPANPERAREIRENYATRFSEVARLYAGTGAAALAALEAGGLYLTLDFPEQALDLWQEGARTTDRNSALRALLEARVGHLLEDAGRFDEAARAHEAAGDVQSYPMRGLALGDSVRCWLAANNPDEALRVYERIEQDFPDVRLPDYVTGPIQQLRTRRELSGAGSALEEPS